MPVDCAYRTSTERLVRCRQVVTCSALRANGFQLLSPAQLLFLRKLLSHSTLSIRSTALPDKAAAPWYRFDAKKRIPHPLLPDHDFLVARRVANKLPCHLDLRRLE